MLIKVKAVSNAKSKKVIQKTENSFEVHVKEPPIRGLANQAIINALVGFFGVSKSNVRLIKGAKQRSKIFEIKTNNQLL